MSAEARKNPFDDPVVFDQLRHISESGRKAVCADQIAVFVSKSDGTESGVYSTLCVGGDPGKDANLRIIMRLAETIGKFLQVASDGQVRLKMISPTKEIVLGETDITGEFR